ncbi:MAG: Unknown protein [uncultured Thiotrichaceae bacterium]|uniref:Xcc1710-like domain-containing protein n=1 Tax=uncultured Thiotrichaceae bacterium TaxID=298394 RepID=A0A6S6U4I7_9GAMM|nr:MAG: Unknown protein [uncultured Thiotrichaceae bacterium]
MTYASLMKFTEDLSTKTLNTITGYGKDYFAIREHKVTTSHIVAPKHLENWPVHDISELTLELISPLLSLSPEILIFGTGEKHQFPDKEILKLLIRKRICYEFMDTMAACRTYNILVGEGRLVVAGLMLNLNA